MMIQNLSLKYKIGIIFTISLLLNSIGFLVIVQFIDDHKNDGNLMNLASKQLLLSQQLIYETALISEGNPSIRNQLEDTMNKFEVNHQALLYGNTYTSDIGNEEIIRQIDVVLERWLNIRKHIAIFIQDSNFTNDNLLNSIQNEQSFLLDEMEKVVSLIEENSENKIEIIFSLQICIMLVNLIMFLFGLWASKNHIVKPLVEIIGKMKMVSDGNVNINQLKVERQDEVGQLSVTFNVMVSNLKHLVMTGKFQRDFLPAEISNETFTVKTIYHPSDYVSGDFYNYIWSKEDNRLYGYLIDVMGHGLSTALQTSQLHVLFQQAASNKELSLSERVKWINEQSIKFFSDETFGAGICFEFDFNSKRLKYTSCGINYFLASTKEHKGIIKISGSLLGILNDIDFEEYEIPFNSGDHFYFLTDGVLDILQLDSMNLTTSFETIYNDLKLTVDSDLVKDDASAICFKIN